MLPRSDGPERSGQQSRPAPGGVSGGTLAGLPSGRPHVSSAALPPLSPPPTTRGCRRRLGTRASGPRVSGRGSLLMLGNPHPLYTTHHSLPRSLPQRACAVPQPLLPPPPTPRRPLSGGAAAVARLRHRRCGCRPPPLQAPAAAADWAPPCPLALRQTWPRGGRHSRAGRRSATAAPDARLTLGWRCNGGGGGTIGSAHRVSQSVGHSRCVSVDDKGSAGGSVSRPNKKYRQEGRHRQTQIKRKRRRTTPSAPPYYRTLHVTAAV